MSSLYNFPKAATFGRMLAKSKIYDHATPSSKVKELFVKEVEKIIWSHKLSPATINLPASDGVHEIQIFTILLRTGELSQEVLHTIDKAIPSPILFELKYGGKIKYAASYKQPSEADKSKWVLSSYFLSDWVKEDGPSTELPVVLNMGTLYQSLLTSISPLPFRQGEKLDDLVSRVDLLRVKEREAEKVESRIKKEKQFNRRVELNRTLNALKQEIEQLRK
ncbi:DUF4391 domain-containing protein [Candidatus Venteria ishoeyi]|uniref:Methyl-accepting chemotaxis protein n=1 Tax=Candidatus Venteria ishoeyi TaxID=1899563 RepID=A0A1H6F515_9GAMM|nr:DUF4391 domain-containing protein [Candidatus Venteria ishoeyi]SEH05230.1 Uncharacterised protein [Candidatus Venteria ishoeyi]